MKTKLMQLADALARANQAVYKDAIHKEAEGINLARAALEAAIEGLIAENEKLRSALVIAAAANAWKNFGECRAFVSDALRTPAEVDAIARAALGEKS